VLLFDHDNGRPSGKDSGVGAKLASRRRATRNAIMDPLNPDHAESIFVEYARLLERDLTENRHPARADSLPYAKPVIRAAIRISVRRLADSGHLTAEMREYFETAYVSLADYLDGELVDLLTEFRRAGEQLTTESAVVGEKTGTAAWHTLVKSGALAGEVARVTTTEAEELRKEFQAFATAM